jgi:hypothetical protein
MDPLTVAGTQRGGAPKRDDIPQTKYLAVLVAPAGSSHNELDASLAAEVLIPILLCAGVDAIRGDGFATSVIAGLLDDNGVGERNVTGTEQLGYERLGRFLNSEGLSGLRGGEPGPCAYSEP